MKTNVSVMKRRFPFEKVPVNEKKRSKVSMQCLQIQEFIGIKGNDCNEREQEETHAGFEAVARDDPASDSQEVTEESYDDLFKVREAALKKESSWLVRQVMKYADRCEKMRETNERLLAELKSICKPDLIASLEAMNPGKRTEIGGAEGIPGEGDA